MFFKFYDIIFINVNYDVEASTDFILFLLNKNNIWQKTLDNIKIKCLIFRNF